MTFMSVARNIKRIIYNYCIDQCRLSTTILFTHDFVLHGVIPDPEGFTYAVVRDPGDPLALVISQLWGTPPDIVTARLTRGDECYLGMIGGQPAHMSWVQFDNPHYIEFVNKYFVIPPATFMIYHANTLEPYRGLGIYPSILYHIVDDKKDGGYYRIFIYTLRGNRRAKKCMLRVWFKPERKLVGFWLLDRKYFAWEAKIC